MVGQIEKPAMQVSFQIATGSYIGFLNHQWVEQDAISSEMVITVICEFTEVEFERRSRLGLGDVAWHVRRRR